MPISGKDADKILRKAGHKSIARVYVPSKKRYHLKCSLCGKRKICKTSDAADAAIQAHKCPERKKKK